MLCWFRFRELAGWLMKQPNYPRQRAAASPKLSEFPTGREGGREAGCWQPHLRHPKRGSHLRQLLAAWLESGEGLGSHN